MKNSIHAIKLAVLIGFALFFGAKVSAQVVYTDVNPDLTSTGTYNLDLNNDGTTDFIVAKSVVMTPPNPCKEIRTQHYIRITPTGSNAVLNNASGYPLALAGGSTIQSSSSVWSTVANQIMAASGSACRLRYNGHGFTPYWDALYPGLWFNTTNGYWGLKLIKSGQTYFGWARLSTANALSFTIKDYAYNNTPDHSILTGSMSGARMLSTNNISDPRPLSIYPNPVFTSATIAFSLSESQNVVLSITDIQGRIVKEISGLFPQGESRIEWATGQVGAGVYFLRFQSAQFSGTEKIIVSN